MSNPAFDRFFTTNPAERFFQAFEFLWRDSAFGRLTATAKIVLLSFTDKWARWIIGDKRKLKYSKGIPSAPRYVRHLRVSVGAFPSAAKKLSEAGFIVIRSNRPFSDKRMPTPRWKDAYCGKVRKTVS